MKTDKVKTVKGDLLAMAASGEVKVIGHGCNCFKTMGAGIANAIRKQWPEAHHVDRLDLRGPIERFGGYTMTTTQGLTIVNLYTQFKPGGPGEGRDTKESRLNAIRGSLTAFNTDHPELGKELHIPKIGAGIAGGDWDQILQVIEEVCPWTTVIVLD